MIDPSVDAEGLYRIANNPNVLDAQTLMAIGEHPNSYPELRTWAFSQLQAGGPQVAPPAPPVEKKRRPAKKERIVRARIAKNTAQATPRKRRRQAQGWLIGGLIVVLLAGVGLTLGYLLSQPDPEATNPALVERTEPVNEGELAAGPSTQAPAPATSTKPIRASGEGFDCVTEGKTVECAGTNASGELGLPADVDSGKNTIELDGQVLDLIAGARFACATSGTGVTCWGNNQWRQTAQEPGASPAPAAVENLKGKPVDDLWAGDSHACALSEGEVWCWGSNNVGQAGQGSSGEPVAPTKVGFGEAGQVTEIFGNRFTTCAVREGKEQPWCWGSNLEGVITADNPTDVVGPTPRHP